VLPNITQMRINQRTTPIKGNTIRNDRAISGPQAFTRPVIIVADPRCGPIIDQGVYGARRFNC
jgi:hypothetical protein